MLSNTRVNTGSNSPKVGVELYEHVSDSMDRYYQSMEVLGIRQGILFRNTVSHSVEGMFSVLGRVYSYLCMSWGYHNARAVSDEAVKLSTRGRLIGMSIGGGITGLTMSMVSLLLLMPVLKLALITATLLLVFQLVNNVASCILLGVLSTANEIPTLYKSIWTDNYKTRANNTTGAKYVLTTIVSVLTSIALGLVYIAPALLNMVVVVVCSPLFMLFNVIKPAILETYEKELFSKALTELGSSESIVKEHISRNVDELLAKDSMTFTKMYALVRVRATESAANYVIEAASSCYSYTSSSLVEHLYNAKSLLETSSHGCKRYDIKPVIEDIEKIINDVKDISHMSDLHIVELEKRPQSVARDNAITLFQLLKNLHSNGTLTFQAAAEAKFREKSVQLFGPVDSTLLDTCVSAQSKDPFQVLPS